MRTTAISLIVVCLTAATSRGALWLHVEAAPAEGGSASPQTIKLHGPDARRQLLATASSDGTTLRDLTRDVTYDVAPPTVAKVDPTGLVTPLADGTATVTAKSKEGETATLSLTVENFTAADAINFPNQIVPIFTKTGCNGGGCHGKSSGQNGFRLSLLGFEPTEDYEHLVREARGRRLFPAAPASSLLLTKATATMPHGGGKRLGKNDVRSKTFS